MTRDELISWLGQKADEQEGAALALGPQHGGHCRTAAIALRAAAQTIIETESKLQQCESDKAQLQYALENETAAFIDERDAHKADLLRLDAETKRANTAEHWGQAMCHELEVTVEALEKANEACEVSANRITELAAERDAALRRLDSILGFVRGANGDDRVAGENIRRYLAGEHTEPAAEIGGAQLTTEIVGRGADYMDLKVTAVERQESK